MDAKKESNIASLDTRTPVQAAVACCSSSATRSWLFFVNPHGMLGSLVLPSNLGRGASPADSLVGVRRKRFRAAPIAATAGATGDLLEVDFVDAGALSAGDSVGTSMVNPPEGAPAAVGDGQGVPACMLSTAGQDEVLAGGGHEVAPNGHEVLSAASVAAAAGHSGKAAVCEASLEVGQAAPGKAAACVLEGCAEG